MERWREHRPPERRLGGGWVWGNCHLVAGRPLYTTGRWGRGGGVGTFLRPLFQ